MLIVEISACLDPDHPRFGGLPPGKVVRVASLPEASAACRRYIDTYDLGSGGFSHAKVRTRAGGPVTALISYNGRVWTPERDWRERREIRI